MPLSLFDYLQRWMVDEVRGSLFEDNLYWVGGAIRDKFTGRVTQDFDLVVEKKGGAEQFAHFLFQTHPGLLSRPHALGQAYPIWQLSFKENLFFKGEEIPTAGLSLEIADTQREMFPDAQTRQRVTHFGSLEEDCRRRDFTCNMLYMRASTGEILDLSGSSIADIQQGLLRTHPQVSAEKILSDDPLRILRLFRFQANLAWRIDPALLPVVAKTKHRLKILSSERIQKEWLSVISKGAQSAFFKALADYEILPLLFPELLPMMGCRQDPLYHSEGDVWIHTLKVIENAPTQKIVQLAALLHDVGKPGTQSFKDERIQFIGHEKLSAEIAEGILKKWHFSQIDIERVKKLILLHLRGYDAAQWASLKPARKLLREAGEDLSLLLDLIEADTKSSLGLDGKPRMEALKVFKEKLIQAQQIEIPSKALLDGHELMALLKIPPGPEIKKAQLILEDIQDEWASQGKVLDVTSAREEILKFWTRQFKS